MSNKKLQPGFSSVLVLIILLLVVSFGVGAYFLLSGRQSKPAGSLRSVVGSSPLAVIASPSSISTNQKLISYSNPKYKFTIDYPDYLTLTPTTLNATGGPDDWFLWHTAGNPMHEDRFGSRNVYDGDFSLFIRPAGGYNQFDKLYDKQTIDMGGEKVPYTKDSHWIFTQTITRNGYEFNFEIYRKDLTNEILQKDFLAILASFKFTN